jgi:hypothetical protein
MAQLNPPNIGIISTIPYTNTKFETQFRAGVNDQANHDPWLDTVVPLDDLGPDEARLCDAVDTFNNNAAVGLIVTVGGAAPARIAWQTTKKPFISLFGGRTGQFPDHIPKGNFWGGVTLNTYRDNSGRLDHLTGRDHSAKHFPDWPAPGLVDTRLS